MGSRSKQTHRGDAWVPRDVLDLLLVAVGAKAPKPETADTARDCARKLQSRCRKHYVSATRLRDHHKWTAEQSYQPWAIVTGSGRIFIVPKSVRRSDEATIKQVAVPPDVVLPHDADDRADDEAEWIPLGNSGRNKPIWDLPAWTKIHLEPKGAEWIKDGLTAATHAMENRPAMIPAAPDNAIKLAYCWDLCAYWGNPDQRRPVLTGVFDKEGRLQAVEEAEDDTPAEVLDADQTGWEEALAVDAESDAQASRSETSKALASTKGRQLGDEA